MPLDWEKIERLRLQKYGSARDKTGSGWSGFEAASGITKAAYRHYYEQALGTREMPHGRRTGGVTIAQAEAIARGLDVPLTEILDNESHGEDYQRGLQHGRRQAIAEMHDQLNQMLG